MEIPHYAALIRAFECTPLLTELVESLRKQSTPPISIIIVDSSRDVTTSLSFDEISDIRITYPSGDFNFARAINVGVEVNDQPLTLIISSHMRLNNNHVIEKGLFELQNGFEIVYWSEIQDKGNGDKTILTRSNFNGRNGIFNSMAIFPTHLLNERPFREEVFSAEDQEWTKYYLDKFRKSILRINTDEIVYHNPQHNSDKWSETKLMNEELSIAYYVNRRLLMPDRIVLRLLRGIFATCRGRFQNAKKHFSFAWALASANFVAPKRRSRYF